MTSLTGCPRLKTRTLTFSAEVDGLTASTALVDSPGLVESAALAGSVGLAAGAAVGAAPAQAASKAPAPRSAPLISVWRLTSRYRALPSIGDDLPFPASDWASPRSPMQSGCGPASAGTHLVASLPAR